MTTPTLKRKQQSKQAWALLLLGVSVLANFILASFSLAANGGLPSFLFRNSNSLRSPPIENRLIDPTTRTTIITPPPAVYGNRTLTLIVEFSGELGNHLMILANAFITKRRIERELPGIRIKMVGQHQDDDNDEYWQRGARDLKTCFVNFRDFEVSGGKFDGNLFHNFAGIQRQQEKWLGSIANASSLVDVHTPEQIDFLKSLLNDQKQRRLDKGNKHYSLPYLIARRNNILDHDSMYRDINMYRDLREWFRFDEVKCCPQRRAEPDEAVFHFRNFKTELDQQPCSDCFLEQVKELSAEEIARLAFGDRRKAQGIQLTENNVDPANSLSSETATAALMSTSNKVLILSRFTETAQHYVDALKARGWDARLSTGNTGMQDFCVALSTQSMFLGVAASTYAMWAGYLGNASIVRGYDVERKNSSAPLSLQLRFPASVFPHPIEGIPGRTVTGQRNLWYEVYGNE